jgi:hypothetical protein
MIEALSAELAGCRTDRDFLRVHHNAERDLTPLELSQLLSLRGALPPQSRAWLARLSALTPGVKAPQRYARTTLHPNVTLYSDATVPKCAKRLVIAFCGLFDRLMMPLVSTLQHLPSAHFDLAVLSDESRGHYLNGIGSYANDLPSLTRRLRADLQTHEYDRVVCYGTSMGGFAALRCGVLLGADRAVSVGGRYSWDVQRLLTNRDTPPCGFDLLCACVPTPAQTALISIYSGANKADRLSTERLSRVRRVEVIAVPGIADHNVVYHIFRSRSLDRFYSFAFGMSDELDWIPRPPSRVRSLLRRMRRVSNAAWQFRRGFGPARTYKSATSSLP